MNSPPNEHLFRVWSHLHTPEGCEERAHEVKAGATGAVQEGPSLHRGEWAGSHGAHTMATEYSLSESIQDGNATQRTARISA